MGPLDAFWHLLNFFTPAVGVGCLGAAAIKLLWRRDLAGVAWRRLAAWGSGAGAMALLAGLLLFGRDGRMASYALLVFSAAAAFWCAGCRPGTLGTTSKAPPSRRKK
ncbi:MAG: hypothetical protein WCT47_21130 [Betaproteobacteria bacterium]|jgi:hypothetical protein